MNTTKNLIFLFLASLATAKIGTLAISTTNNIDDIAVIYTQTNSNDTIVGNEVVMYLHKSDNTLQVQGRFETGGTGSNFQIASQDGMIIHNNKLLTVNSNSNTVTVFKMNGHVGLTRTHVQPSLGLYPNSIAAHDNLVYVLNSFGVGTISGFILSPEGTLKYKRGSLRVLNAFPNGPQLDQDDANQSPSQVGFTPNGRQLIVLLKGSATDTSFLGSIRVYDIDEDGFPSAEPTITFTKPLSRPFSFNIIQRKNDGGKLVNVLLLTNADGRSVSSFIINQDGSLNQIGQDVDIGDVRGICWNVNNDKFMYASATPSQALQSFRILNDGSMELLNARADSFQGPAIPLDIALAGNHLYTLQVGFGTINAYFTDLSDGSIRLVGTAGGLEPARVPQGDGFERRNSFAVGLVAQIL